MCSSSTWDRWAWQRMADTEKVWMMSGWARQEVKALGLGGGRRLTGEKGALAIEGRLGLPGLGWKLSLSSGPSCPPCLFAKLLQSCPTLCDPIDGSPTGSPVPGILQARILEWVAISFSNAWKWKVKVKSLSGVWLLATPWTAAHQAPPSMGFSRQEYWSGVPLPSPLLISRSY